MVGRLLGEARRVVEGEVAVDLVGRDVVEAHGVPASGLEQLVGALDVGAQEGLRIGDRVVVVRLGGVVHDGVVARDEALEQLGVADVAHHELHPILGQAGDVLRVARVGELVEDGHAHVRVLRRHVAHEVRADEAAAAGHDDVSRAEGLL